MKTIQEIEKYAHDNFVPIARKPLVDFLINQISQNGYKTMLEVGTGIAYTCISLCLNSQICIKTIEHSKPRYDLSLQNINDFNLGKRIEIFFGDAEKMEFNGNFDIIFIDAAKLKNQLFFDKFSPLLSKNGIIIIDNMDLSDFEKYVSRTKFLKYKKANDDLIEYLSNLKNFSMEYLNIGDGILFLKRK